MNITILTIGSRGDVQPFISLGVGLQQAGHKVRLATHAIFKSMAQEQGLDFAEIEGNPQEFMQSETAQAMMRTRNPIEFSRRLQEALKPLLTVSQLNSWDACEETDAIVAGGLVFWGMDIAERLGVPCCYAFLQPAAPTRAFPVSTFPPTSKRFGGLYNRFTYGIVYRLTWQLFRNSINQFRQSVLQLPTIRKAPLARMRDCHIPILNAVSPSVIPVPPDWTALDYMTGYWFLERSTNFVPPGVLLDFLADGSAPVYIGFGSMGGQEVEQATEIALAALKETGQRGLLLTGWSGIEQSDLPDAILKVSSIPHDWLFPQMMCIVHHGGAGTSAATFRSGIPGIPIPFLADQPFWAYCAFELGVSPAPIDRKTMTIGQLAEAIQEAICNLDMRNRAAKLAEKIRSEDGVGCAVDVINQTIESF